MSQYAVAFDLKRKEMQDDGFSESQITQVYQREVPEALAYCGFSVHLQGSIYATDTKEDHNQITSIITLESTLKSKAPNFCQYVNIIHVFRMDEWSDITNLIFTNTEKLKLAE